MSSEENDELVEVVEQALLGKKFVIGERLLVTRGPGLPDGLSVLGASIVTFVEYDAGDEKRAMVRDSSGFIVVMNTSVLRRLPSLER